MMPAYSLRTVFVTAALIFLLSVQRGRTAGAQPAEPPNIVLVVVDDQGYADLGCYGAKGFATPNIDRLAHQGVRFTNFYVSQAVSSASRASILTGCYAERVSIAGALNPFSQNGLSPAEETLAELLQGRGYTTGIVGKWHLGHLAEFHPLRQGFDEYFGLPYSNDMWPVGFDGRPAREGWKPFYPPLPLFDGYAKVDEVRTLEDQARLTRRYTERAVEFVRRHKDRPFFLYLAHTMVHVPLGASEEFRGKSRQGPYGDVMMEVDWSVGQVLEALQRDRLEEKTVVIYTSDNGPWLSMGNHGGSAGLLREGKGTAFEGGARVPCIVWWPGHFTGGEEYEGITSTIDILPTLCAISGATRPSKRIDGVSLLPILTGADDTPPRTTFAYYYDAELRAVREGRWKLFFPHTSQSYEGMEPGKDGLPGRTTTRKVGLELYDLSVDSGERNNVAPLHPDVVRRLQGLGDEMRRELGDRLTATRGTGVRAPGRVPAERTRSSHLAIGMPVRYNGAFSTRYRARGDTTLVDGMHGSTDLQDNLWQGFEGLDLDVIIDLHQTRTVRQVTVTFLENQYSWIFPPKEVTVAASVDGKEFRTVGSLRQGDIRPSPAPAIRDLAVPCDSAVARYLRVVARNQQVCPGWHPGVGGTAWLFVDEIEVH